MNYACEVPFTWDKDDGYFRKLWLSLQWPSLRERIENGDCEE